MSKNKAKTPAGIVYSTDPDFKIEEENDEKTTLPSGQQKLRVILDKKQRAGKSVTLVTGFDGNDNDLEDLGKKLKSLCGTGGTVKDGEIMIQGDNREKILKWLLSNGFMLTKKI